MATNLNISTNSTTVSSNNFSITVTDNNTGNVVNISPPTNPTISISAAGIQGRPGIDSDVVAGTNVNFLNITASGEISASGVVYGSQINLDGGTFTSASLANLAGLGNHTATQDLNLNGNNVINLSTITDNQNLLIFSGSHQNLTIGDVNEESSGTFFQIQDTPGTFQFGSTGSPGNTQLIADTIIANTVISSSEGKFSSLKGNSPLVIEPDELRISSSIFNINSDVNLGKNEAGGDARLLNAKDIPLIEPLVQGTTSSGVQGSGRTQFGGNHEVELYSLGSTKIYSRLGSSTNKIGSYILIGSGSLPGGNVVANTDTDTIRFGSGSSGLTTDFYGGTDTIIFNTAQGHITASGTISASGTIVGSNLSGTNTGDQNLTNLAVTGSNVIFANITASGNISASGNLSANQLKLNNYLHWGTATGDNGYIYDDGTELQIGYNDTDVISVHNTGTNVTIAGDLRITDHITASGNISASGDVYGKNFYGVNSFRLHDAGGTSRHVITNGSDDLTITIGNSNFSKGVLIENAHLTASGNISASGNLNASNITTPGTLTVGHLEATTINTLQLTSSIVTSSVIFSSGSNIFGDEASDTHTFNGNITASGNISSSAGIAANHYLMKGHAAIAKTSDKIAFGFENNTAIQIGKSSNPTEITGNITASGNISSSGTITSNNSSIIGRQYFGEVGGSNIHFTKAGNNLALNNGGLTISEITASGNISASGDLTVSSINGTINGGTF